MLEGAGDGSVVRTPTGCILHQSHAVGGQLRRGWMTLKPTLYAGGSSVPSSCTVMGNKQTFKKCILEENFNLKESKEKLNSA